MTSSWKSREVSANDAVTWIENGMRVFIHGACASPQPLLEAMVQRSSLSDVTLSSGLSRSTAP